MPVYLYRGGVLTLLPGVPVTPPTAVNRVRVSRISATNAAGSGPVGNPRDALPPYGTYNPSIDMGGAIGLPCGVLASPARVVFNGDFHATSNGQVIKNLEVFGLINLHSFTNCKVQNCLTWGTMVRGVQTCGIIGDGSNLRGAEIIDCEMNNRGNFWSEGLRGSNYALRRSIITNCPDGVGFTTNLGNRTLEGNWIHNGLYAEWDASKGPIPNGGDGTYEQQAAYYTHNDGVQFHIGGNDVIRGNMIGGVREPWDHHLGKSAEINSGDDLYNSCILIKQEVNNAAINHIHNVLIEMNWFLGGAATINITTPKGDATGPKNYLLDVIIRNNRFIRSTWDAKLLTRIDNNGVVMDPTGQGQMYILRDPGLAVLSGNVFDDTGLPVPIRNGNNNV